MKTTTTLLSLVLICSTALAERSLADWQRTRHDTLSYLIYQPKSLGKNKAKLMISLHGCSQKAQDLADLANWEETAEAHSLIVVLPEVPNGGVMMGCWDYYGQNHNETNRNNGPLISLAEDLLKDPQLNIDKNSVYVSGLSSGAAQAALLGCLRPDLFGGVGINSGPAVGTEMGEIYSPNISSDQVSQFCEQLAGSHRDAFRNQMTALILDNHDYIVNPAHSALTSEAMQKIYGTTTQTSLDLTKLKGANTNGSGQVFADSQGRPRLSLIINTGLGHAWASGKGSGTSQHFVNPNSLNFPEYLAQFFSKD